MKSYYVYFMTNRGNTTLYIGFTNENCRRGLEHKYEALDSFTKRYKLKKLIYVEEYSNANAAISREKQLKKWSRAKKENLIASQNPEWRDYLEDL